MININTLFNEDSKDLHHDKIVNPDKIIKNVENISIICGDFYSIQNFIFEKVPSSKAYKILRAKSAYIQIFTKVLAKYIVDFLGLKEENILFSEAGKIEIISSRIDSLKIETIQKELDDFFIDEFFALTGIRLISVDTQIDNLTNPSKFKELREEIDKKLELSKFNKFDLVNQKTVLEYKSPTNQTLCKTCEIRDRGQNQDFCEVCQKFINIGKNLASKKYMAILEKPENQNFNKDDIPIFKNYYLSFSEKSKNDTFKCLQKDWKLKSYVKLEDDNSANPMSFDKLIEEAEGAKNLAVLKGDVDSLGKFIQDRSNTLDSYENYIFLAHTLNNFFTLKVYEILETKYKNTYTIFTGGDDFFLIGTWNEIVALAKDIYEEFKEFTNEYLTLCVGVMLTKDNVPITYMASKIESLLEKSKNINDKEAITLFGETVKWQEYIDVRESLEEELNEENIDEEDQKSAFFYNLLDLVEMSIKAKYFNDIESTIWKSKLNYSFRRNMNKNKYEKLYETLAKNIKDYPKATKMVISEFIYKRRD